MIIQRGRGRPAGDHAAHRRAIAEAAWRVIDRDGLEGLMLRGLAREIGCTTGVLTHYFPGGKDELLAFALAEALQEFRRTVALAIADRPPREALEQMAATSLPLDARRRAVWRVYVAFSGRALWHPHTREHLRERNAPARRLVADILRAAVRRGELPRRSDVSGLADLLVAQIDGLAMAALFDPERFSAARQMALVRQALDRLFATSPGGT